MGGSGRPEGFPPSCIIDTGRLFQGGKKRCPLYIHKWFLLRKLKLCNVSSNRWTPANENQSIGISSNLYNAL